MRGQAMIEFTVALVVVMALFAGLLQVAQLGFVHTETMNEARRDAGALALLDTQTFSSPDYIFDRTTGADQAPYTRDDGHTDADPNNFAAYILDPAHPDELQEQVPNNEVSALSGMSYPQLAFGFIRGRATQTNAVLPVVRHLMYSAPGNIIEVQSDAWMTWTRGIY